MKKLLLVGLCAASMLLGSGVGHASSSQGCNAFAHSCSASDSHATTIEPILTRSNAAEVSSANSPAPNKIENANIQSFSLTASGGVLKAVITTKAPMILCKDGATRNGSALCPAGDDNSAAVAPYTGQHVLILFQTNDLEKYSEVQGQDCNSNGVPCAPCPPTNPNHCHDVTWGTTVGNTTYQADGFRWELQFGYSVEGGVTDCQSGYYDPTGSLNALIGSPVNLPVFFGQSFYSIGQVGEVKDATGAIQAKWNPNTTCSISNGDKTVTITQPYTYKWNVCPSGTTCTDALVLPRQKALVSSGEAIKNVSAFSWLDEPVAQTPQTGLILGWTWYTDWLPQNSYDPGLVAGDPNPNKFMGPKCTTNTVPSGTPLDSVFGPPGPCTIANPTGPGYRNSGLNVSAG